MSQSGPDNGGNENATHMGNAEMGEGDEGVGFGGDIPSTPNTYDRKRREQCPPSPCQTKGARDQFCFVLSKPRIKIFCTERETPIDVAGKAAGINAAA